LVAVGLFLVVVWASTGRSGPADLELPPPLPARHKLVEKSSKKEFMDFDYKYEKQGGVRHVKEEVARALEQGRALGSRSSSRPSADTGRGRDSLNGVPLPAQPPGRDWAHAALHTG
jgi:hypothetical protein